jgi:N-acetylmuramoyl-L-alanine amidase
MSLDFGPLASLSRDSVLYLVVHTQGAPGNVDGSARSIHEYHRAPKPKGRGWSGIGYHRVIRKNGSVEKGRPLNRRGAHVNGLNHVSVGICCSGNGDLADFTAEQKRSLRDLLRELLGEFPRATVEGHRPVLDRLIRSGGLDRSFATSKTCPGKLVNLEAIRQSVGGVPATPPGVAEGPATGGPRVGERRWSNHLKEGVVLTRYVSDSEWFFLSDSQIAGLGSRAGAKWSEMPAEPA